MVQGSKTLQYLRKSQLLALPGVAEHFLETATSLLMFAVTCQGSSPPSAGTSAAVIGKLSQSSSLSAGKLSQNIPCLVTFAVTCRGCSPPSAGISAALIGKLLQNIPCLVMFAVTSQGSSPPSAGISAALIGKLLQNVPCLVMFAVTCQGSSPPSAGDSAALLGNAVTERAFLCDFLYISHAEGRRSFTCRDDFDLILLLLFSSFRLGVVCSALPDVTVMELLPMPASI